MREIKFKGKRIDNGVWAKGCYQYETGSKSHFISDGVRCFQVNPETVGQYTGMKDSTGVEIYEGDILDGRSVVSFNNINCGGVWGWNTLTLDEKPSNYYYGSSPCEYEEVTGSIHDNPELLEKK